MFNICRQASCSVNNQTRNPKPKTLNPTPDTSNQTYIMKPFLKLSPLIFTGILLVSFLVQGNAQSFGSSSPVSDPFEGQFFSNRYLGNPAMAGLDSGLNLNAAYRQQFSGMPGAPVTQAFTADDNPGKRVGLGLIAYNDKAGLIKSTRLALTYAYHLPVGQFGEKIHFGISAALAHVSLDPKSIVGDQTDPEITAFNARKNAFEVDYGMAYTDGHITLQGALTNIIGFTKHIDNTTSDVPTFYGAASYKFTFSGTVNSIEPQVSMLGVKQYNSIVYAGANLVMFSHILNLYGMMRSTGNFSAGVGLNYKNILHIQGSYLTQTSGLRNYTNGNYEVDLTLSLFRKK